MAVSRAGGLGFVGAGYADNDFGERELAAARIEEPELPIGCGIISWCLAQDRSPLDRLLALQPATLMLAFADPAPFAPVVSAAGIALTCQVHTLEHARRALDAGATVVIAQGSEAGGHGRDARGLMSFLPELQDLIAARSPETLLIGAGGIADGRGLAAALTLGADGVMIGTRLWATSEAVVDEAMIVKALGADGDSTIRTRVYDILKGRGWPK
ncbi:MAG: nitronate monooxygenase, partial [Oligoflexus sp.]